MGSAIQAGRFYEGRRTPEVFLAALAAIHRTHSLEGRLSVEFVGGGMAAHESRARMLGLQRVASFTGRVDPAGARARAAAADVLLIIDAPSDGPSLFLPSKLVDYLPLRKPILALTPRLGPSADLVNALGYAVIDPADEPGIAAAIENLLAAHAAEPLVPSPQHDQVSQAYDIRETTRSFARILDEARGQA